MASSIMENRELRRQQLMDAAITLAAEGNELTVTAIARQAGISRASVYEYFSSTADLITDLVVEEMESHYKALSDAISLSADPVVQLDFWIRTALEYSADGRHLLIKSFSTVTPPDFRRDEITLGHRKLMTTLANPLVAMGFSNPRQPAHYIQNIVDSATTIIDSGNEKELEIQNAIIFAQAGVRALLLKQINN
jgi:AcrR family transcriptional regulator